MAHLMTTLYRFNVVFYLEQPGLSGRSLRKYMPIKAATKTQAIDIAIQYATDHGMQLNGISIPSPGIPVNKLKRKKPSKRKYKLTPDEWANCT